MITTVKPTSISIKMKAKKVAKAAKKGKLQIFKTGDVGITKDYSLFTPLELNRGRDNSIDPKRLANRIEVIKSGRFHRRYNVLVNQFGFLLDGNHTFEALRILGMPIAYEVYPTEYGNTTDRKILLGIVSEINSVDSRWSKVEMFKTAYMAGFPLAKVLQSEVLDINNSLKVFEKKKSVKPTWVYALLKRDADLFKSGDDLRNLENYNNPVLVKASKADQYLTDKKHYIDLCNILNSQGIQRFSRVAGAALGEYWTVGFDIVKFKKQLVKYPFSTNVKDSNTTDVMNEIQRIQRKK